MGFMEVKRFPVLLVELNTRGEVVSFTRCQPYTDAKLLL